MTHHSYLKREYGDTVIIGASSLKHIEQVRYPHGGVVHEGSTDNLPGILKQNLVDLEKGPLRESLCFVRVCCYDLHMHRHSRRCGSCVGRGLAVCPAVRFELLPLDCDGVQSSSSHVRVIMRIRTQCTIRMSLYSEFCSDLWRQRFSLPDGNIRAWFEG